MIIVEIKSCFSDFLSNVLNNQNSQIKNQLIEKLKRTKEIKEYKGLLIIKCDIETFNILFKSCLLEIFQNKEEVIEQINLLDELNDQRMGLFYKIKNMNYRNVL